MASSSTLSWHERGRLFQQRLEEEVALGRIAWADGIAWITWGVSSDALTAVSSVGVDQEGILAVSEREDHRLVSVTLQWSLQRRAAPFPACASGAGFADRAKLRLPAVREAIEQKWQ